MGRQEKIRHFKDSRNCGICTDSFKWGYKGRRKFLDLLNMYASVMGKTRTHPKIGHVMVTLQGTFKGETGYKWHMMTLVENNLSGLEVSNWVSRWLNLLAKE